MPTYATYPVKGGSGGTGPGTVTSVGLTAPTIFTVSGSPVTNSGTLSLSLATETAATVFAGPVSGAAATPTFRILALTDLPATANTNVLLGNTTGGYTASGVSSTTLTYLDATSSIQTQLNGKQASGTYVTTIAVASSNGLAGTSSGGATPTLTLSTSITGLLKGNGTAISAATSGTDYSAGTSALATGLLKSTTATGALSIATSGTDYSLGTSALATGILKSTTATGALSIAVSGTDYQAPGNYITALTGQVTATGPGSVATTITANTVTNAQRAQMAANTIKGNNTGSTANEADLTVAQVNAILPVFTSTLNGLVPLSGGGTTNFLRADGSFAVPPSSFTINYYSGTFGGASSWTSSSTSFSTMTNSGGATLTQVYGSGITVTAAASTQPGITFTPSSSAAIYRITATFSGANGTVGQGSGFRLTDGTTPFAWSWITNLSSGTIAAPTTLTGIYAPGTSSAVTVNIQATNSGSGTSSINGIATTTVPSLNFQIEQLHA